MSSIDAVPPALPAMWRALQRGYQAEPLLLVDGPLELHVRADLFDLLRRHPAAAVSHRQQEAVVLILRRDEDRRADLRELQGVIDHLAGDLGEVIRRDGNASFGKVELQIAQSPVFPCPLGRHIVDH